MGGRPLAGAFVLAALAPAAAGAGAATFPDPPGDVRGGAGPDVVAVAVTHTAAAVRFRIRFAQAPPLRASASGGWVDMLIVGIDLPPRSARWTRGGWTGIDLGAGLHAGQTRAIVFAGPRSRRLETVPVTTSGRTVSFAIPRRRLGDPAWFELVVAAGREAASGGGSDTAPPHGLFHYRLR